MGDMPRVRINTATVRAGLANPTAPLWRARDAWMFDSFGAAFATAPVNDPLNAVHRGGVVGTYQASFRARRLSNLGSEGFKLSNVSDHAAVVEFGRRPSTKPQTFSWTRTGGQIRRYKRTSGRDGEHIMADAVQYGLAVNGVIIPSLR
jgi:hypothetical protein